MMLVLSASFDVPACCKLSCNAPEQVHAFCCLWADPLFLGSVTVVQSCQRLHASGPNRCVAAYAFRCSEVLLVVHRCMHVSVTNAKSLGIALMFTKEN